MTAMTACGKVFRGLCTDRSSGDFAARYGSDQFAVLVGSADESQALELAERVAQKVRNLSIHHPRSPVARFVTVSYGVASEIPAWTAASTTIFDQAEEQLAQQSQSTEEDSRQAG